MKPISLLSAGLLLVLGCLRLAAAEGGDGDARLRTALRDLTLQLRTAQGDLATAQAGQAALAAEKKDLQDKYESMRKQSVADRTAGEKTAATQAAQLEAFKAQVTKLTGELDAAKAEGAKSAQAAQATEAQRGKLAGEVADLKQRIADREAKNLALFLLGNEILNRYEDFSLGKALMAKEPFVGKTRTRLENLVQDYQDRLADQRVQP